MPYIPFLHSVCFQEFYVVWVASQHVTIPEFYKGVFDSIAVWVWLLPDYGVAHFQNLSK